MDPYFLNHRSDLRMRGDTNRVFLGQEGLVGFVTRQSPVSTHFAHDPAGRRSECPWTGRPTVSHPVTCAPSRFGTPPAHKPAATNPVRVREEQDEFAFIVSMNVGYSRRMGDDEKFVPRDYVVESIKADIELSSPSRRQRIFEAIALAALGSIPWVGGVIAAASAAAGKYRDGEAAVEKEG